MSLTQLGAQNFQVKIVNGLTKQPLSNVLILDQNQHLLGESNSLGQCQINIEKSDVITFRLYGYEILEQSFDQIELSNYTIKLYPAIEELEAIELVSKKRRVQILYSQFELWDNGVIAITKDKKKIIVFDAEQKPLYEMKIPVYKKDKMTELFQDADDRLYLLGENHVIQLHVTNNNLFHFSAQNKEDFNKYIKNLKLVTNTGANIYRDLSRISYSMPVTLLKEYTFFNTDISYPKYHNCGTDFIAYQLGEDPKLAFSTIDTNAFYAANREFFKYVGLYIAAQGSPLDRRWGHQQHSYNTLFSRFKSAPLFNYKDKILILDVFNNALVHLTKTYETDTVISFNLSKMTRKIVALQDQSNERIWLYERQKHGRDVLYELIDGQRKSTNSLFVGAFTRNVRIQNDWIYHLNAEYKIERQAVFQKESSTLSSLPSN
jgi:hypothetical protein